MISFRKLEDNSRDYHKLHKWCQEKFVYEWFEQRILSYDEIILKYQNKLNQKIQDIYIIQIDNKDIGLVQIYKYNDNVIPNIDKYNNVYEYDIFIGESNYISKGFGSQIINIIDKKIFSKYNADLIILRPFKRNIRAIKCYKKCGYDKVLDYNGFDTLSNPEIISVLKKEKK